MVCEGRFCSGAVSYTHLDVYKRQVVDVLSRTFKSSVSGEEHQSVDEMLVPFKGSILKQYLKQKPKKWGFKI